MDSTRSSAGLEESKEDLLSLPIAVEPYFAQKGSPASRVCITIDAPDNSSYFLRDLDPNEPIYSVRRKIEEQFGYTVENTRLIYSLNGGQLDDHAALGAYDYQNCSFAIETLSLGGTSIIPLTFNPLDSIVKVKFNPSAPIYRRVSEGLNFASICENLKCSAYKKEVIVPKGFKASKDSNTFNVNEVSVQLECPLCHEVGSESTNCGFFMAKWSYEGIPNQKTKQGKFEYKRGSGRADTYEYHTFKEGKNIEWRCLAIKVEPLD